MRAVSQGFLWRGACGRVPLDNLLASVRRIRKVFADDLGETQIMRCYLLELLSFVINGSLCGLGVTIFIMSFLEVLVTTILVSLVGLQFFDDAFFVFGVAIY